MTVRGVTRVTMLTSIFFGPSYISQRARPPFVSEGTKSPAAPSFRRCLKGAR
jgi:hypothetical protein